MANVINLTSKNFDEIASRSDAPVLVDFWAEWCGPCKGLEPTIQALAQDFDGRATIAKVNADEESGLARKYGVRGLPTVLLFQDGEVKSTIAGPHAKGTYASMLDDLIGGNSESAAFEAENMKLALYARLACLEDNSDEIKSLFEQAPELLNAKFELGKGSALTVLDMAIMTGNQPHIDLVLSYRPELSYANMAALGSTDRLEAAIAHDREGVLRPVEFYPSALLAASETGQVESIKTLLDEGADVNSSSEEFSPLAIALMRGREEAAVLLIERGADVNFSGTSGGLGSMALNLGLPLVQLMVKHGLDYGQTGKVGKSLAETARSLGKEDIADYLDGLSAS